MLYYSILSITIQNNCLHQNVYYCNTATLAANNPGPEQELAPTLALNLFLSSFLVI
jgi:hypothetical protein